MNPIKKVFDAHPKTAFTLKELSLYSGLSFDEAKQQIQPLLDTKAVWVVPECRNITYYRSTNAR